MKIPPSVASGKEDYEKFHRLWGTANIICSRWGMRFSTGPIQSSHHFSRIFSIVTLILCFNIRICAFGRWLGNDLLCAFIVNGKRWLWICGAKDAVKLAPIGCPQETQINGEGVSRADGTAADEGRFVLSSFFVLYTYIFPYDNRLDSGQYTDLPPLHFLLEMRAHHEIVQTSECIRDDHTAWLMTCNWTYVRGRASSLKS